MAAKRALGSDSQGFFIAEPARSAWIPASAGMSGYFLFPSSRSRAALSWAARPEVPPLSGWAIRIRRV